MSRTGLPAGARAAVLGWAASSAAALGAAAGLRWGWADRIAWPVLGVAGLLLFLDGPLLYLLVRRARRALLELRPRGPTPGAEWRAGEVRPVADWIAPRALDYVRWELISEWPGAGGTEAVWRRDPERRGGWCEEVRFGARHRWAGEQRPRRRLRLWSPLGLWAVELPLDRVDEVHQVLPARIRPPVLRRPRELVAGEEDAAAGRPEGDRIDFRRHQEGDSARHIAWKLWARHGNHPDKMLVRIPELVGSPRVGFVFCAGGDDEPAAELFLHLLERGTFGPRWVAAVAGAPGRNRVFRSDSAEDLAALRDALCASAGQSGEAQLKDRIELVRRAGVGLTVLLAAQRVEGVRGRLALRVVRPGAAAPSGGDDGLSRVVVVEPPGEGAA